MRSLTNMRNPLLGCTSLTEMRYEALRYASLFSSSLHLRQGGPPKFGLQFIQVDDQPKPVYGANMDVIGIIGPCSTANPTRFPLNTPVLVFSNDITVATDLGGVPPAEADGYLLDAINGIIDQFADFEVSAQIVIVRTDYGTAADANLKLQQTIAKIMGNAAAQTGVHAFVNAPQTLYCTPRMICAPGYTGQQANSLDTIDATTPGVGYTPNATYQITFTPGAGETNGANLVLPVAHAIADANGNIDDPQIFIDSWGAYMTVAVNAQMPPPDGPPVLGVAPTGLIIFSQNPGIGATITLNGTVVTFQAQSQPGVRTSGATLAGGTVTSAATGWFEFLVNPSNNDTITIDTLPAVTFVTGTATGNQVHIGATLSATLASLNTFLNSTAPYNTNETYTTDNAYFLNVAYKTVGTAGNAIGLAGSVTAPLNQVVIGPDLGTTLNNLLTFLTNSADAQISLNTYGLSVGTITITSKAANTAGNSFTLATTVTGASLSGSTLSGGRNAAASTLCILVTTLSLGANPVCAELTTVLDTLIAHAWVESAGVSYISDLNWRDTMNSQRLVALSGGVKIVDPVSGAIVVMPRAPREIGLQLAVDFSTGGPGHSAANRPIQGIVAPARNISFNLLDDSTEGQQLLEANIGIIVRGLVGVETAISSGGFIGITLENCGDDPLWQMVNVKRMRDYIHLSLMPVLRTYLGRTNITKQTVINILSTIGDFLGTLKAREQILDYRMYFPGDLNSADEIRLGHLTVGFRAEEPPVLERITTMSARYKPAIDNMVQQLEQQLNIAAALMLPCFGLIGLLSYILNSGAGSLVS